MRKARAERQRGVTQRWRTSVDCVRLSCHSEKSCAAIVPSEVGRGTKAKFTGKKTPGGVGTHTGHTSRRESVGGVGFEVGL